MAADQSWMKGITFTASRMHAPESSGSGDALRKRDGEPCKRHGDRLAGAIDGREPGGVVQAVARRATHVHSASAPA